MSKLPEPQCPVAQRVVILMGVYDGERFLPAQLDSFAAQTHQNWALIASDDSGKDGSAKLILDWVSAHPACDVTVRKGPQQGFARNFMTMIAQAPQDADYLALSDQDDVWFPDKLSRALDRLSAVPAGQPALYCAATLVCAADLRPLHPSAPFPRPPCFRNALIQSIGGGNTMVLNRAAADLAAGLAAASIAEGADPVSHDWWLYQIISGCGGTILRDDDPVLCYRQHKDNLIGANRSTSAGLARLKALLAGRFHSWNTRSLIALTVAEPHFTPEARQVIGHFRAARQGNAWSRIAALRRSGVLRQSPVGTTALYIACLLNRL